MKSFHHAESTQSASSHYAPSVPMSVYRELATEMRANKAVIDSLNSRNHQLMQQNQRLKQEIHNVVQATLNLGQFAGVARQAQPDNFPSEIAPDTLSRLVRAQRESQGEGQHENQAAAQVVEQPQAENNAAQTRTEQEAPDLVREIAQAAAMQAAARRPQPPVPAQLRQRAPRPIQPEQVSDRPGDNRTKAKAKSNSPAREAMPKRKPAAKQKVSKPAKQVKPARPANGPASGPANGPASSRSKADLMAIPSTQAMSKLFTEQSGEYRSSVMESGDEKEIGGIWLALSIVLIIVTAFGAGFLIMKPLLNDR